MRRAIKARHSPGDLRSLDAMAQAIKRYEPRIARRFEEAVRGLDAGVNVSRLMEAIRSGSVRRVEEALAVDRLAPAMARSGSRSFVEELQGAMQAGARLGRSALGPRGARITGSLDLTNPESIRYLARSVPRRLAETTDESIAAVRQAVTRGFTQGRPVAQIAREVRQSVGLTQQMESWVENFRQQLETGEIGGTTEPWERRLSAVEARQARRILREGVSSRAQIDSLVQTYRDRLLNRRARNIAGTEAKAALHEGQQELWRKAEDEGLIDMSRTRRMWIVTPDERLSDSHAQIPGMNPQGRALGEPFRTPDGPAMTPADTRPNCRCTIGLEFDD